MKDFIKILNGESCDIDCRLQYGLESMSLYWFSLRFLTSYSLSETSDTAKYDKSVS